MPSVAEKFEQEARFREFLSDKDSMQFKIKLLFNSRLLDTSLSVANLTLRTSFAIYWVFTNLLLASFTRSVRTAS